MAIRKPDELTPDLMVEWSKKEIGLRIVVTGTRAKCLEDLANEPGSYGALSAIETVTAVRANIQSIRTIRLDVEGRLEMNGSEDQPVHVSCFETIREAMLTLEDMPLGWIHLGHGSDGKLEGDGIARLSNVEEDEDWIRTEEISAMIADGVGPMLFCILPVCHSSQSGDVLQNNPNILAIHATDRDVCTDFSGQFIEMPKWIAMPEWRKVSSDNFTTAATNIYQKIK